MKLFLFFLSFIRKQVPKTIKNIELNLKFYNCKSKENIYNFTESLVLLPIETFICFEIYNLMGLVFSLIKLKINSF